MVAISWEQSRVVFDFVLLMILWGGGGRSKRALGVVGKESGSKRPKTEGGKCWTCSSTPPGGGVRPRLKESARVQQVSDRAALSPRSATCTFPLVTPCSFQLTLGSLSAPAVQRSPKSHYLVSSPPLSTYTSWPTKSGNKLVEGIMGGGGWKKRVGKTGMEWNEWATKNNGQRHTRFPPTTRFSEIWKLA